MPKKVVHNCEHCVFFKWRDKGAVGHVVDISSCRLGNKLPRWRSPNGPLDDKYGFRTSCEDWCKKT